MNDLSKIIRSYIDEMYPMEKGMLIVDPDKGILIGDAFLTRKQIKHIVEQRKAEGKSADEIKEIFDFEVPNSNLKYFGSVIRYKVFRESQQGIAVVMDKKTRRGRIVITSYPCSPAKIFKIQKSSTHLPLGRRRTHKHGV